MSSPSTEQAALEDLGGYGSVDSVTFAPGRAGAVTEGRVSRTPLPWRGRLHRALWPRHRAWQLILLLVLLGVWQFLGSRSDPFVFAPPTRVAHTAVTMIESGELGSAVTSSLADLFVGLAVALAIGLPIGFAMGLNDTIGRTLNPFVAALYAVPPVALVPVFVAWTGLGLASRVAVIVLFAVFEPLFVVRAGVAGIDSAFYDAARVFGARRGQLLGRVTIPAALPFVLVGVRMASVRAVKGMVVAQVLVSAYGLGGLITASSNAFRIDKVLVVATALALLAVLLSAAVGVAERCLVRGRR